MKIIKLLVVTMALMVSYGSAIAQGTGIVKFLVDVDNGYFEIEINDTMLLKRYKDTLPAGTYDAKIWSPGYITKPISFTVVAGKTVEKYVEMAKNNDFIQYEQDYKAYRNQFHKQLTLPLSLTLVSTLTAGTFMVRAYDLKQKIAIDIDNYHIATDAEEIDGIKLRISENNVKFNKNRRLYYVGAGFSAICIGGTIWSYLNFKKNNTEPTFFKESPFKEKYSFNITPFGCSFILHI